MTEQCSIMLPLTLLESCIIRIQLFQRDRRVDICVAYALDAKDRLVLGVYFASLARWDATLTHRLLRMFFRTVIGGVTFSGILTAFQNTSHRFLPATSASARPTAVWMLVPIFREFRFRVAILSIGQHNSHVANRTSAHLA